MDLHFGESCEECIARFVGPALYDTYPDTERIAPCGGCGRTVRKVRFSYYFPYPD